MDQRFPNYDLSPMLSIIESLWNLCLMRVAPQDLPFSKFLLWLVAAAYALIGVLIGLFSMGPVAAALSAVIDTGVLLGLTMLVLWVKDSGERYTQAATAMAGSGAILMASALPLLILQAMLGPENNFTLLLVLILVVWKLSVVGHILRHALDTSLFVGLLLSVVYLYVSISVFRAFFLPYTVVPT